LGLSGDGGDGADGGGTVGGGSGGAAGGGGFAAIVHPEIVFVAVLFAAATIFFGIIPGPMFDLVSHVGNAFGSLF
jgi:preprotein translocase subunit SecG